MNIFGRHDLIQPWTALPIDEKTTLVTVYTQLPEEYFDTAGFEEKNKIYGDFIKLVATEDLAMLESLQNGVGSRGFVPGPTVKLERAIHHFQNYYLDQLLKNDDESRKKRHADCVKALKHAEELHGEPKDGGYSKSFLAAE